MRRKRRRNKYEYAKNFIDNPERKAAAEERKQKHKGKSKDVEAKTQKKRKEIGKKTRWGGEKKQERRKNNHN